MTSNIFSTESDTFTSPSKRQARCVWLGVLSDTYWRDRRTDQSTLRLIQGYLLQETPQLLGVEPVVPTNAHTQKESNWGKQCQQNRQSFQDFIPFIVHYSHGHLCRSLHISTSDRRKIGDGHKNVTANQREFAITINSFMVFENENLQSFTKNFQRFHNYCRLYTKWYFLYWRLLWTVLSNIHWHGHPEIYFITRILDSRSGKWWPIFIFETQEWQFRFLRSQYAILSDKKGIFRNCQCLDNR